MRILLMLLIFAVGFSGYSAAAHAFGHETCDPAVMAQMADDNDVEHQAMDMSDCPGHQVDQGHQKDADTDKTANKGKCMDCTHCCTSHAMSLPDYRVIALPQTSVSDLNSVDLLVGDFLYSLKRPPKSLV